jgi:hypothetical protein
MFAGNADPESERSWCNDPGREWPCRDTAGFNGEKGRDRLRADDDGDLEQ